MTICIAAIAKEDDTEHIVFATDHMVSTGVGQFEHSITKYKKINHSTVAMLAGNPSLLDDLTRVSKDSYIEIKEEIRHNFQEKRKEIIEREVLAPLGLDYHFVAEVLKTPQLNAQVHRIVEKMLEDNLKTGILLIGFDEKQAQITEINQENTADFRALNFHAIGSGDIQATNTLLFQKHSKTDRLATTIYNVYKAKRNAEVLQGVGKETDLLVLSQAESCRDLKNNLTILNEIYEEELSAAKNSPKLKELVFGD